MYTIIIKTSIVLNIIIETPSLFVRKMMILKCKIQNQVIKLLEDW